MEIFEKSNSCEICLMRSVHGSALFKTAVLPMRLGITYEAKRSPPGEPKVIVLQLIPLDSLLTFNPRPTSTECYTFTLKTFPRPNTYSTLLTSQLEKRTIPAASVPLTVTMAPSKWGTSSLEINLCALGTSPLRVFGKLQLTLLLL